MFYSVVCCKLNLEQKKEHGLIEKCSSLRTEINKELLASFDTTA